MGASKLYAVVAEFDTQDGLLNAARTLRDKGFRRLDAMTPFPVHGIDEALGIRHSPLGFIVAGAGITGTALSVDGGTAPY